jgi:2-C-methyl-D-erythritol 2,4-cyclodiphosphate synthase
MMGEAGFAIGNVDATVIAQEPRLAPHLEPMRASVADLTGVPLDRINIKASSTDHLGAIGRGEGIASLAVVLLVPQGEGP